MEQEQMQVSVPAAQGSFVYRFLEGLSKRSVVMQLFRFGALGVLNTAIDFILLNFLSKSLNVTEGSKLGFINVIGFTVAVLQSYIWNRAWVFAEHTVSLPMEQLKRLVLVGGLGALGMIAVLIGAQFSVQPFVYLVILVLFVAAEVGIWYSFDLRFTSDSTGGGSKQFTLFILVSVIGLLLNSSLVAWGSNYLQAHYASTHIDLYKNVAKLAATAVSLVWNFVGYKLLVFRVVKKDGEQIV